MLFPFHFIDVTLQYFEMCQYVDCVHGYDATDYVCQLDSETPVNYEVGVCVVSASYGEGH